MTTMERRHLKAKVVWDGSTDSDPLSVEGFSAGMQIELPAGFTGASLTYKRLADDGTTWLLLKKAGSAVTDVVASGAGFHVLSVDLFGADAIKVVSDQSETCTGYIHGSS